MPKRKRRASFDNDSFQIIFVNINRAKIVSIKKIAGRKTIIFCQTEHNKNESIKFEEFFELEIDWCGKKTGKMGKRIKWSWNKILNNRFYERILRFILN